MPNLCIFTAGAADSEVNSSSITPMLSRILFALSLLACLLVQSLLGMQWRNQEVESLREQRFRALATELRERIETDLFIGFELSDLARVQGMLEDVTARVPLLLAVEVISDRGISLFNSDRALRGQAAPRQWLDAAARTPAYWRSSRHKEHSIGVALHDAIGQNAGYLVLTYRPAEDSYSARLVWFLAFNVVSIVLLWLLIDFLRLRRRRAQDETDDAVDAALLAAREVLRDADETAHRIAGDRK